MNNLLKNTVITAVLLITCSINAATRTIDKTEMTNTTPYTELVKRSDNVKIFYTDDLEQINCRVEIILGNQLWKTSSQKTDKQTFLDKPLMSCLSHEKAKQLLSRTFIEFGIGL